MTTDILLLLILPVGGLALGLGTLYFARRAH
ncbi:hypothetical protein OCOJLMKI_3396 [Methylobacterium iners]|jgi:hypothetical protein|uniref:Uncharacterized protein n=1 Tax=Methylobacterium iners TaxID=418707 RepID=A0ABQ4S319_9HYPH|nr:hypothetical protein OCOJLMKI_3396 [Methylobacterium iners]